MGEIDRAYRHQRDMALMARKENEKLQTRIEGWATAAEQLDTDLRAERALADDLGPALNDCCVALIDVGVSPPPQAHRALVRYREARQR